jgi:hypothetical protein
MKSVVTVFLSLMMSASTAVAMQVPDQMFLDLESRISHAAMNKDVTEMNNLLASNYVSVGFSGQIRTKTEVIDAYSSGKIVIGSSHEENVTVRQFGSTAILVGLLTLEGKEGNTAISGHYAFTRVYIRNDGKWQAVSFQATPVK